MEPLKFRTEVSTITRMFESSFCITVLVLSGDFIAYKMNICIHVQVNMIYIILYLSISLSFSLSLSLSLSIYIYIYLTHIHTQSHAPSLNLRCLYSN